MDRFIIKSYSDSFQFIGLHVSQKDKNKFNQHRTQKYSFKILRKIFQSNWIFDDKFYMNNYLHRILNIKTPKGCVVGIDFSTKTQNSLNL